MNITPSIWEEIFGFQNPLVQAGDTIHPVEDGKEFRSRWRDLADRILLTLRSRLSSPYDASIPSTLYDHFLRAWAEEMARAWIESEKVLDDVHLVTTRAQYLWQKWGYILHVDTPTFPRSSWTSEVYRTFLQTLLEIYLGGSRKEVIEEGVEALSGLPTQLVELYTLTDDPASSVDISDQFTFDVTVGLEDLSELTDSQNVLGDIVFLLDTVKPAHTKYRLKAVMLDNASLGGGCTTSLGANGYLQTTQMTLRLSRRRSFQGVQGRTIEGAITELDLGLGVMKVDGFSVQFNPSEVDLFATTGAPLDISILEVGQLIFCEGHLVDVPLTNDGFYVNSKVNSTAVCDRMHLDGECLWNYDDIRRIRRYGEETDQAENLSATISSYGTVILRSDHKPWTRGDGSGLPPFVTSDGSGGVTVWYTAPGESAVNVTLKTLFFFPHTGEIELLLEEGVTSPAVAQQRYFVEYYFTSRENEVVEELVVLADQVLPAIRLQKGPLTEGDGTPDLLVWAAGNQALRLFVNGVDRSNWIVSVDPLTGEIVLASAGLLDPTDVVKVTYWFWEEPNVPFILNGPGGALNDLIASRHTRFAYRTVVNTQPEQPPDKEELTELKYFGLESAYTAALNSPSTLKLNKFGASRPNALNRWETFFNPADLEFSETGVEFEAVGSDLVDSQLDDLREALLKGGTVVRSDVPAHVLRCHRYSDVSFRNQVVQEGDAEVKPFFDDLMEMSLTPFWDGPPVVDPDLPTQPQLDENAGLFRDDYRIPEEVTYWRLNDWTSTGSVALENAQDDSCRVSVSEALMFNRGLSMLNTEASELTPDCDQALTPRFGLLVDSSSLWRRGLNAWHHVLWDYPLRGPRWELIQEFAESMGVMVEDLDQGMTFFGSDGYEYGGPDLFYVALGSSLIYDTIGSGWGAMGWGERYFGGLSGSGYGVGFFGTGVYGL